MEYGCLNKIKTFWRYVLFTKYLCFMTDNEIIEKVLQGKRDLYRLLVERYQSMVFHTCMGFLHDKDDSDDLTQEIFIKAYLALSKFEGRSLFSTWLYRIAVNAALNKVRKSSGSRFVQRFESFFGTGKAKNLEIPVPEKENPENILIHNEHLEWLQKAMHSLPENQRTALVLSKYDDFSQREIAQIMNISEGAVESLLHRAKMNLREKLKSFSKKY